MRFIFVLLIVLSTLADVSATKATVGNAPLRCRLDGYRTREIVLEGNRLYFTVWDPHLGGEALIAVHTGTCQILWRFPEAKPVPEIASRLDFSAQSGPTGVEEFAVTAEAVYIVTLANPDEAWSRLTALDAETGRPRFSHQYRYLFDFDQLAVHGGKLLAYGGGRLYGINPENGRVNWRRPHPDVGFSREFVDGLYFLPTVDGSSGLQVIHAVDVLTGADRWAVQFPEGYRATAYATERHIVLFLAEIRTDETHVLVDRVTYAYRTGDGEHLWNATGLQTRLANSEGSVGYGYRSRIGAERSELVAFQLESGAIDWTLTLPDYPQGSSIEDGVLIVILGSIGSWDSAVIGIDRSTGEQAWTREIRFVSVGSMVTPGSVNGLTYVLEVGLAIAIDAVTGRDVWTYPCGNGPILDPVIATESAVVVTNEFDAIFIFEPGSGQSAEAPEGSA